MNLIADTHTHTLATDHAYSTIMENAAVAAEKGLRFLAMTEHTPAMPGAPSLLHFNNLRVVPHMLDGVVILKGAEVNIMDSGGALDLPDYTMKQLDWVIASFHMTNFKPDTMEAHTHAWLAIAENPLVDVIGHCGDGRYPFDEERVIRAFAANHKIVEANAHSFAARPGSRENCPRIMRLCMEIGVRVVVSSDAHFCMQVGHVEPAVEMLEEIGFPEDLVLNADYDRFLAIVKEKAGNQTRAFLETL